MLPHGFQVVIPTTAGAGLLPFLIEDSLKGFPEQSSKFLHPVFVGDTLYATSTVDELTPGRTIGKLGLASTVHNQDGVPVMEGRPYLLRKHPTD
jgi:hypothetical protein